MTVVSLIAPFGAQRTCIFVIGFVDLHVNDHSEQVTLHDLVHTARSNNALRRHTVAIMYSRYKARIFIEGRDFTVRNLERALLAVAIKSQQPNDRRKLYPIFGLCSRRLTTT